RPQGSRATGRGRPAAHARLRFWAEAAARSAGSPSQPSLWVDDGRGGGTMAVTVNSPLRRGEG
ncbi:MAG TPA: hypothetical protein VKA15_01045, partial [Isosphaeraceae bacterium]|nr:hypothetical protein [Isosphaeraceae bacterium]